MLTILSYAYWPLVYLCRNIYSDPLPIFIFYFFKNKGGRKRGRETSMCACLLSTPYWGPSPQPRHVPWLGIQPSNPLVLRPALSPLSHTSQGCGFNSGFSVLFHCSICLSYASTILSWLLLLCSKFWSMSLPTFSSFSSLFQLFWAPCFSMSILKWSISAKTVNWDFDRNLLNL